MMLSAAQLKSVIQPPACDHLTSCASCLHLSLHAAAHLQASEKSIKKYREWLAAIVDTANSLLGAQQQLNEAEAGIKQCQTDLTLYVKVMPCLHPGVQSNMVVSRLVNYIA